MIQQEMGRASGISKPRSRISFYQYCTSKDFYVSKNYNRQEEVGDL